MAANGGWSADGVSLESCLRDKVASNRQRAETYPLTAISRKESVHPRLLWVLELMVMVTDTVVHSWNTKDTAL